MSGQIVRSPEPIEGQFEVRRPPERVSWTFWTDDLPRLGRLVFAAVLAAFLWDWVYRLLS